MIDIQSFYLVTSNSCHCSLHFHKFPLATSLVLATSITSCTAQFLMSWKQLSHSAPSSRVGQVGTSILDPSFSWICHESNPHHLTMSNLSFPSRNLQASCSGRACLAMCPRSTAKFWHRKIEITTMTSKPAEGCKQDIEKCLTFDTPQNVDEKHMNSNFAGL